MKNIKFTTSKECSIGVEIELQIIDTATQNLCSSSPDILKAIENWDYPGSIKPELFQNNIEINTSVHDNVASLYDELKHIKDVFISQAKKLDISFCGGGTHPFDTGQNNKIYPAKRYAAIAERIGYLADLENIFGQHIHIGCVNGDDAIYLTHILSRYLPHFIALSASSPFYNGSDTKFDSSRVNQSVALPSSGHIIYSKSWNEFCNYYEKLQTYKIIETMKDIYWDIRPKPEFGSVEIRISDTPLTIYTSAKLAAYAQTLSLYILRKRPVPISDETYVLYPFNRFQASRFGFDGKFYDPYQNRTIKIWEDILETLTLITPYAKHLQTHKYLEEIALLTKSKNNDAKWLRDVFAKEGSLKKVVALQTEKWMKK